jgi:EAL domain-containing protein (putative c-di-GMP-specific phosphodiesterase class I)/FixJ family two-component response regulator
LIAIGSPSKFGAQDITGPGGEIRVARAGRRICSVSGARPKREPTSGLARGPAAGRWGEMRLVRRVAADVDSVRRWRETAMSSPPRKTRLTPMLLDPGTPGELAALPLRILVVDDEPLILRAVSRKLTRAGMTVVTASTAEDALELLADGEYDVVFSDINMPGMGGVALLAGVRRLDPDVPIVLVTGNPTLETAVKAVEFGALRYLFKPVPDQVLLEIATSAGRLSRLARLKRAALGETGAAGHQLGDLHSLGVRFDLAMDNLWMAFQPIVSWRQQRVVAYEALVRNDEPLLRSPVDLLEAAERLDRVHELGRRIRARSAARMVDMSPDALLFVNLHPRDLEDPELLAADSPMSPFASRIVLEVTERRALDGMDISTLVPALRGRGYRLAVDDLGAGYAGLTSFAQLEPAVAKIDMSLIRGIDQNEVKRRIVAGIVLLCRDMETEVVVEGVETEAERDVLVACGCDWMQGYLFGRPQREMSRWPPQP